MSHSIQEFCDFINNHSKLMVITGAGISASSGIPTYRDDQGTWQRSQPIQHQEFINCEHSRRRYWARSAVGWPVVADATPNQAHFSLAELERKNKLSLLVTQNVDRLHQRAGHQKVIDLHGRVDQTVCLDCGKHESRADIQQRLLADNPILKDIEGIVAPDGDADIEDRLTKEISSPSCTHCGGTPMPDVVFYGGSVPKERVAFIREILDHSDALLVVGSSLSVYSAFRFCRTAYEKKIPIAILNMGYTRADDIASIKVVERCDWVLSILASGT